MRTRLYTDEIEIDTGAVKVGSPEKTRSTEGHVEDHVNLWEALIYLSRQVKRLENMVDGDEGV